MSQLNGVFSLRTPEDLLAKFDADSRRFRAAHPTSLEAQYAAFDFFVTAEHLVDWTAAATGESKSSLRSYGCGSLVSHVANGAKHFRADIRRQHTVSQTGSAGAFQAGAFQPDAFDVERLVIDLEDGSTVSVADVADQVLVHWRTRLQP